MNNELEELPSLLTFSLEHQPVLGVLRSFLTPSEILQARLVNWQWSYFFSLPQFKIQSPPPSPQNPNQQRGRRVLIEQFNSNTYGSGSGRGDFIDRIPIRPCRISILVDNSGAFRSLNQFLDDNPQINRFITHLTLSRCYAYDSNSNQNQSRNQNSNRNGTYRNRNRNQDRNVETLTPLLTIHEFFTLIFNQLYNLEYLSIDRIPLNWTRVKQNELEQLANQRELLPHSRSSLRTLVFSHGWLNLRDQHFLGTFLSLFPNLLEIWGMSLKCSDCVESSRKTRALKSIIVEGSIRTFLFKQSLQNFVDWATNPGFGVELEEIKFNMHLLYGDQTDDNNKSRMSRAFSKLLNYHSDSLKTLVIQPLGFFFPWLFSSFPVFPHVTTLKFNGKSAFTGTDSRNEPPPGTRLVSEESYSFFPLNSPSDSASESESDSDSDLDSDFKLTHHFPNLTHVKVSFYFPNHSRSSRTILNYCFPQGRNPNLIHKGVRNLELVDLAGLMNFDVIKRFADLFPNVENLTLKKNVMDRNWTSGLLAICEFWPGLKELQCKLLYKTGNLASVENWDSAITGFSEEVCAELRRNPEQSYRIEMERRRVNSHSILSMTGLRKFILIFTTDSAMSQVVDVDANRNRNGNGNGNDRGPGFMSSVSWKYGFNLLPNLTLLVIFGQFCGGFQRMLWEMEASSRLKIIHEALP